MNGSFNSGSGDMSGRSIDRRFSNPMQYGISSLDGMTTNNNNVPNLALPNLGHNYNSIIGLNNRNASSTLNYEQQQMISNILRMDKPQTISQRSNSVEERLGILAATGCNQHYEVLKEHHRNLVIELEETIALMNLYYGKNNMQKNIMDRLKEAIV